MAKLFLKDLTMDTCTKVFTMLKHFSSYQSYNTNGNIFKPSDYGESIFKHTKSQVFLLSSKSRSKKEDTPPPPPERTTSLPTDRQPPPLPPRSPDLKKTKEWEDEEDYENQRNSSKDTDQLIPEKKEEENRYGEEVAIDITVLNKFYLGIDFNLRITIIYI